MEIDHDTKEELLAFARSQMTRKGEIDTLIFTTEDIVTGLRRASENLDKVVADVNEALHALEEDAPDG
jgi:hypothetical protein